MDRENSSTTQYKPVTVDVPEDRVAEFHAFFARLPGGPGAARSRRAPWQAAPRPPRATTWARVWLRWASRDRRAQRADSGVD